MLIELFSDDYFENQELSEHFCVDYVEHQESKPDAYSMYPVA